MQWLSAKLGRADAPRERRSFARAAHFHLSPPGRGESQSRWDNKELKHLTRRQRNRRCCGEARACLARGWKLMPAAAQQAAWDAVKRGGPRRCRQRAASKRNCAASRRRTSCIEMRTGTPSRHHHSPVPWGEVAEQLCCEAGEGEPTSRSVPLHPTCSFYSQVDLSPNRTRYIEFGNQTAEVGNIRLRAGRGEETSRSPGEIKAPRPRSPR